MIKLFNSFVPIRNYMLQLHWQTSAIKFIMLMSLGNIILYNSHVFLFSASNLDYLSLNGMLTLATVAVVIFIVTALFLVLLSIISKHLAKLFCMLAAVANSMALYFILTYQVVLDKTMIGNVFNTNLSEASSYLHPKLILYLLLLGILPCWFIYKIRINKISRKSLFLQSLIFILIMIVWAYLNASRSLWIDKYSSRLGSRIMPWSYIGNTWKYQSMNLKFSSEQILLPPATFTADNEKTVIILVIGEAARAKNFSLLGYGRPTNPLLAKIGVIALRNTISCSTYTTLSLRCILSHTDVSSVFSKQYEPLPSYLYRHGVDVIWRTNNWSEPPLKVNSYQRNSDLEQDCKGDYCKYDEVLLSGLGERIRASKQQKIFAAIHHWGSHGPSYYTRYPKKFEVYKPVCKSVELNQCTDNELINAYDNTIVYTDYFLARTIEILQELKTSTILIYISDHGQSLGEYGLYLHGAPYTIAPDVQKDIPFLVWMSPEFMKKKGINSDQIKQSQSHSHQNIFHSVMGAFNMHSDAYNDQLDIFNVMVESFSAE